MEISVLDFASRCIATFGFNVYTFLHIGEYECIGEITLGNFYT